MQLLSQFTYCIIHRVLNSYVRSFFPCVLRFYDSIDQSSRRNFCRCILRNIDLPLYEI